MTVPLPFSIQAQVGCVPHADLALALADEFEPVDHAAASERLDALAAMLIAAGVGDDDPLGLLAAVHEYGVTAFRERIQPTRLDDLLLGRALELGAGHPLTIAVAAVEAARRAGLPLGLACGGGGLFLAHQDAPRYVLDVRRRTILPCARVDAGVRWQCSHQVAERMLTAIGERAGRTGMVPWALCAAQLRLELPVSSSRREKLGTEVAQLRARFN